MNDRVLLLARNTQAPAFCFPPSSTVWPNQKASRRHSLPAETQPEESRGLVLRRVKGRLAENGSGIWNDKVINTEGAIMMEPCFPLCSARARQESAGGTAMKIHAEGEFTPSDFANRSETRSGLPPTLPLSRIK